MQIDIHREKKIVCIWLTRKESSEYKNEKSPIKHRCLKGTERGSTILPYLCLARGIFMTVCMDCSYITAVRWQKRN